MKNNTTLNRKGFTLIEVLLVIAIIAILAGIVVIAVDPVRQIAQARNAQRASDLNAIDKAIKQYYIDNRNWPGDLTDASSTLTDICNTGNGTTDSCIDLEAALVPTYIATLPENPSGGNYQIMLPANNQIQMIAPGSKTQGLEGVAIGTSTDAITEGDGGDDGGGGGPQTEDTNLLCSDNVDNDNDGNTDCNDSDCSDKNHCTVLALRDGLVGYWPLDENLNDYSDNGNNGSCTNCPIQDLGKINGSYTFNGLSEGIQINNFSIGGNNKSFSLAFWIKLKSFTNTNQQTIFRESLYTKFSIVIDNINKQFYSNYYKGGWQPSVIANLNLDEWSYMLITYDGSLNKLSLYKDSTFTNQSSPSQDPDVLTFSNLGYWESFWPNEYGALDGSLDEVAIWNRALSESEISQLYNNGSGLSLVID